MNHDDQIEKMREAKRLIHQATAYVEKCPGCVDLALALNILLGLVQNHRHHVDTDFRLTGPMQAMEGR